MNTNPRLHFPVLYKISRTNPVLLLLLLLSIQNEFYIVVKIFRKVKQKWKTVKKLSGLVYWIRLKSIVHLIARNKSFVKATFIISFEPFSFSSIEKKSVKISISKFYVINNNLMVSIASLLAKCYRYTRGKNLLNIMLLKI